MESLNRRRPELLPAAAAFAFAFVLAACMYRTGRRLTFDSYHYCEFAKLFKTAWPDRFGGDWPFGYSLLGALGSRLGWPAYESLVAISCVALFLLLTLAARILTTHPLRWAVLVAFAAAPIVTIQLLGILTELPFAATLLGLALCLSRWPARGSLWGASALAVLALSIRYAGVIAFAVIGGWTFFRWAELRSTGRRGEAIVAGLMALAIAGALLFSNVRKSGHVSGADRGNPPGLSALPAQLTDFGWSAPSALIAGGLRDLVGPAGIAGRIIGGLIFGAMTFLCGASWCHPRSVFSRPLALVAFGYATGMVALHCIGGFDALYNARTFLPALIPFGLLAVEQLDQRKIWIGLGCSVVVGMGVMASLRGISGEVGGNVWAAVTPLRLRLAPDDTVAINDRARSLSAYLPQQTAVVSLESWHADQAERFVVISGKPRDRAGTMANVSADWVKMIHRLVASGHYRYILESPSLLVLEKTTPAL